MARPQTLAESPGDDPVADDPELGTILHQQGLGLHRVVLREVGLGLGKGLPHEQSEAGGSAVFHDAPAAV